MCGLIGWISPRADEAVFRKALGLIAHRGPDGEGVFEGTAGANRVLPGGNGACAFFTEPPCCRRGDLHRRSLGAGRR